MSTLEAVILIFVTAASLLLIYVWLLEPRWLEVSYTRLRDRTVLDGRLRKREGPLPGKVADRNAADTPGLPPGSSDVAPGDSTGRLDVLFFSDVHAGFNSIGAGRISRVIEQTRPDVVLFGGDLVNGRWDAQAGLKWIGQVSLACREQGIPLLGVWGNHDRELSRAELESSGMRMLANQSVTVSARDGSSWQVTGLADLHTGQPDLTRAICETDQEHESSRRIILAHNPDTVLLLPEDSQSLVLSGHFHGGQIRLPFRFEYRTLRREQLCRSGFYDGLYRWGGHFLYITRGIGCVLVPFRMGARPELTLLTIETTDV